MKRLRKLLTGIFVLYCALALGGPVSTKATLDLRGYDFVKGRVVSLNNYWEFYWNQLLTPDELARDSIVADTAWGQAPAPGEALRSFVKLPKVWNTMEIGGQRLPPWGYATYRMKIIHDRGDDLLALRIGELLNASRVWVNGTEIASTGRVAPDREQYIPELRSQVVPFNDQTGEIEIVIQMANFDYKDGGVKNNLEFGTHNQMERDGMLSFFMRMFLLGALIMIAIFHLILSFFEKNALSNRLYGLFIMIISLRILVTNEYFIMELIPSLGWEGLIKLIVIDYYIAFVVFMTFLRLLFVVEFNLWVLRFIQVVGAGLTLFVLLTPARVYGYTETWYQYMVLLGIVYVFWVFVKAIRHRRKGVYLLIIGLLAIIAGAVNDVLYALFISPVNDMLPIGVFIFALLQSYILLKYFSNAVSLNEQLAVANEELRKSNATKDKLFSIISHDLRGPIGNLSQLLAIAEEEDLTPEVISGLARSAENSYSLINDLLNWASVQSGTIKAEPEVFTMGDLLLRVIPVLHDTASAKEITLLVTEGSEQQLLMGDLHSVETVLRNLVSNAIKFTRRGGKVIITARKEGQEVQVTVKDNGVGIPDKLLHELFTVGSDVSRRGTEDEPGTGLGLLLCKEFVEMNKGRLGVSSRVGEGSEFYFTLPAGSPQG